MAYTPCYPTKRNWANLPSESSPINETNLNAMDNAIYTNDGRIVDLSARLDTDETELGNKVDKVVGKGLSQVDNVEVIVGTTDGTQIGSIKTTNIDGSQTNRGLYNGVVVDSALSDSSTNPVQNQVVKSALDDKVDKEAGKGITMVAGVSYVSSVNNGTVIGSLQVDKVGGGNIVSQIRNGVVVDSALSDSSTNPVENKAIYDALNNLLPSKTVSGNPISISDASGFNAKALTVTMNPIQDLHGYDNPWVGGAGKNKLPFDLEYMKAANTNGTWSGNQYSLNGVTFTINDDGTVLVNGTASANTYLQFYNFPFVSGTSYVLNGCPSGGSGSTFQLASTTTGATGYDRGSGATIITSSDITSNIRLYVYSGNTQTNQLWNPMIRLSTESDATFAPYSNICPISGRTEASVKRTGVNQWDEEWELGSLNTTNGSEIANTTQIRAKNYVPIQPSKQYYFKADNPVWVLFFDANKAVISENLPPMGQTANNARKSNNQPFTTPPNCAYIRFYFQTNYGTTYNHDTSVNYPSNITAYYAYNGSPETHTHQYSDTIYGGSDDFVNGEGKNEWGLIDLGTLNWQYHTQSGNFYADGGIVNRKAQSNAICSQYVKNNVEVTGVSNLTTNNRFAFQASVSTRVIIRDTTYTDAETFKTAMDGVQLCYELATPTTISTSAENITLLKGNNVLSTNADDMELKYSVSLDSLLP